MRSEGVQEVFVALRSRQNTLCLDWHSFSKYHLTSYDNGFGFSFKACYQTPHRLHNHCQDYGETTHLQVLQLLPVIYGFLLTFM